MADVKVYEQRDVDARNALRLPITLPFPDHAVQTFSTDWVTVRWVVKFAFVCCIERVAPGTLLDLNVSIPPDDQCLRLDWELDVPLVVVPQSAELLLKLEPSAETMTLVQ